MEKTFPTYEEAQRIVKENGINSQSAYKSSYNALGLPSNPNVCYKGKGWIDWHSFFGKAKVSYPAYEEAKRIVQENGITSSDDYKSSYKELGLPANPSATYKNKGWIDWYSFFGRSKVSYPTYEEAQRIVKENGITSQTDYRSSYQALGLPSAPDLFYKNRGWIDWHSFFGKTKASYPTYEEAQRIVKKNGVNSKTAYKSSYKELGLPSNPNQFYRDKGWIDWYVFLGTTKVSYSTYEEAQRIVKENGINSPTVYNSSYNALGLPYAPYLSYKDKGWVDWYDFLGTSKGSYPHYKEAQRIVKENGINSINDYKSSYKELGLPSNPNHFYRDKGWIDWHSFFGRSKVSYPTYEEAQRIVQENGITSQADYKSSYKELGLPSAPYEFYKGKGWIDWPDFFGRSKVSYPIYEEAQRIVKENGINSINEYKSSYRELGLPANPHVFYKNRGWIDWFVFLGKPRLISKEDRKYNILKRLAITPALLKDDAPLQVIYIFVSQFNKELAKEIETLLGTSSYEERLNWVKEQLKGLKDGSSSKAKSFDETSIDGLSALESSEDEYEDSSEEFLLEDFSEENLEEDTDELSAIESIVEENKDVMDTLSEEKLERLKIIYENYVHSVANRELIAEFDDKRKKHTT